MLPGLTGVVAGINRTPPVLAYQSKDYNTSSLSTYTFTGKAIGTASEKRYVLVVILIATGTSISSATVAGQSTSIVANGTNRAIVLTDAPVTSGTTATIVVNTAASAADCAIGVYSVTGDFEKTPIATLSVFANDPSGAINVSAGGFLVAGSGNSSSTTPQTSSWTNITKDAEETAINRAYASLAPTVTESRTITCTWPTSSSDRLIAASFAA